jgi:hypothetical protein
MKIVGLLFCLSLSVFTVAAAMKPTRKADARPLPGKESYVQEELFDMSEAEEEEVVTDEDTNEGVASTDDDASMEEPSDEGEDMGVDDTGDDDAGGDDDIGEDGGGDDRGNDGGD